MTDSDDELAPGTQVGEYRIDARIGTGSTGIVYRAVHSVITTPVAIKVLSRRLANDRDAVARFIEVARSGDDGTADIFAFGEVADGRPYYAMKLRT